MEKRGARGSKKGLVLSYISGFEEEAHSSYRFASAPGPWEANALASELRRGSRKEVEDHCGMWWYYFQDLCLAVGSTRLATELTGH